MAIRDHSRNERLKEFEAETKTFISCPGSNLGDQEYATTIVGREIRYRSCELALLQL
jgi:hypothetical protein